MSFTTPCHHAGEDGKATLAHGEAYAALESDRLASMKPMRAFSPGFGSLARTTVTVAVTWVVPKKNCGA